MSGEDARIAAREQHAARVERLKLWTAHAYGGLVSTCRLAEHFPTAAEMALEAGEAMEKVWSKRYPVP
jgi:hypothetical protein